MDACDQHRGLGWLSLCSVATPVSRVARRRIAEQNGADLIGHVSMLVGHHVGVDVERQASLRVPDMARDRFDVGARGQGERHVRMALIMDADARNAG